MYETSAPNDASKYFPQLPYDSVSQGVWFHDMAMALEARNHLKVIHPTAVYDVLSRDDAWQEAEENRKELIKKTTEIIPDEFVDDDAAISGDNDEDPMLQKFAEEMCPAPLLFGKAAITIAKTGIGNLCFCRGGFKIPVTWQEAQALVSLCPNDIQLFVPNNGKDQSSQHAA